jgi:predicted DNA-binding transcriptional regulator YafY
VRRADRLFAIIQTLRRRRTAITAAAIAERLEVSPRTVYRDIQDLVAAGTPIDGEAGVGYRLKPGYDLPPLMFDADELQALVLGARIVRAFGDARLAKASASILAKVASVVPRELEPLIGETRLYAPALSRDTAVSAALGQVRAALDDHRKLRLTYRVPDQPVTMRVVRPLGAFFWGRHWTLSAWCELRDGFRSFRLDRADAIELLPDTFEDEPGKRLEDLLRQYGADLADLLGS